MKTIRTFIAVDFSPDILSALKNIISQTRRLIPDGQIRMTPIENLHLTLKFLGEVEPDKLQMISPSIRQLTSQVPSFSFQITGQGVFPNPARASVLWIGCSNFTDLTSLAGGLDQITQTIGIPREQRPFKPHLTIARINTSVRPGELSKISTAFLNQKIGLVGESKVDAVTLYKSELSPGGAKYTILEQYPLASA